MKLSTRTLNIIQYEFQRGYIKTVDPSKVWPEYEGYLIMLPNISQKRLSEIKDWLAYHGGRLSSPPPRSSILRAIKLLEENGYKITPPESN